MISNRRGCCQVFSVQKLTWGGEKRRGGGGGGEDRDAVEKVEGTSSKN